MHKFSSRRASIPSTPRAFAPSSLPRTASMRRYIQYPDLFACENMCVCVCVYSCVRTCSKILIYIYLYVWCMYSYIILSDTSECTCDTHHTIFLRCKVSYVSDMDLYIIYVRICEKSLV